MRFDYPDEFLTVDGLAVRYWDQGRGDPLLLIHGMGACLETWAWNVDALSAAHRVVALDLPGCGRSSRPECERVFTLQYAVQFLRCFTERLGIATCHVAGNSLGGVLALALALDCPEMVRRLILVDSGGLGREVHWLVSLMTMPVLNEILRSPSGALVERIASQVVRRHDATTEELFRRVIAYSQVPGTGPAAVKMIREGVDLKGQTVEFHPAELGRILAPTLVIWGEEDQVIPARHADYALQAIPDCRAVVVSQAGHAPQIDRPEVFNQLVLEFLSTDRLAREENPGRRVVRL